MSAPKLLVVDDNQELLSLLTQLFEEAGYQVLPASKGKQALELARDNRPDAALVDVLLPDTMGYTLADQLRGLHPKLPFVFMTGVFKGGKHAMEAKNKHGAVAYFEKPFEAAKLLDAVRQVAPAEAPRGSIQQAFDVELDIDIDEELPQDAMELTGRIRVSGDNISAELSGSNLTARPPELAQMSQARKPAPDRPVAPVSGGKRGELHDNLPSLINAFHLSRETGELGVQRGKVKKVIYFEKGQPVFAQSNLLSDRFGQFLVRVGKIRPGDLKDAAEVATATHRRTGDVLIERGVLKDTERLYYVGQQVKSIIYSLFAYESGQFVLSFREKAARENIKLDVHPANLIVRGVKKLYKPERLKRLMHLEDRLLPSLQPAYQLHEVSLEKWEAELLPKIDGTRNVAELQALCGKPEHVLLAFLVALTSLGILEKRA